MSVTTTTPITSTTSTSSATGSSILGKDDFLKLLLAQLKNQDPLNPMQGTEFASQLAQFSSVEQLSNINETLTQSVSTNQLMTQSISNSLATTMIGKTVKSSTDSFAISGSASVTLGYTLASDAAVVTTKIYNKAGTLVRTLTTKNVDSGDGSVTWDGKDEHGSQLGDGTYTFKVTAVDADNTDVSTSTNITGTITGVRFTTSGTVFVVDGVEVPLSKIVEIMNGKSNG